MAKNNASENSPFCDDVIPVSIKYVKNSGGTVVIVRDRKNTKKFGDKVSVLDTTWSRMSFADANEIMTLATKVDEENGLTTIDWGTYRKLLMERNLKEWNIEGRPCNNENIGRLDIVIATELIDQYIAITMPSLAMKRQDYDDDEFDESTPILVEALTQLENVKQNLSESQRQNGDLSRRVTMLEETVHELTKGVKKKK